MASLQNILFAGKCGSLLAKLSADEEEGIRYQRVIAHAACCGISSVELPTYLETLKALGCVDWDRPRSVCQVLSFSRHRVLVTVWDLFRTMPPTATEDGLLDVLEICLSRPQLQAELEAYLGTFLSSASVEGLLGLTRAFSLLESMDLGGIGRRLYFNGYQFGDRITKVAKALSALPPAKRDELDALISEVRRRPGTLRDGVSVSPDVMTLAIGLGLVEVSKVASPSGSAEFLTMPKLAPPSVGKETAQLEDDAFHHTKILLSSLRYGEVRSRPSRGRINDIGVLVDRLLTRDEVGPCTAIGQDYVILEQEGVIRTRPAPGKDGQFYMQIRRREPAEMVLNLLHEGAGQSVDAKSIPRSLELPLEYQGPELHRPTAARTAVNDDPATVREVLEALRT